MKILERHSLLALTVAGILMAPVAQATNGYFAHGYSTKEKALAGAGTALSHDALAAATNPAGMVFVGERMDIGLALFRPSPRSYTLTGSPVPPNPATGSPGSGINAAPDQQVESDGDLFFIPHFGYNLGLTADSTIGVSVYGNGGMNTEFSESDTPFKQGTFGTGKTTGVNLEQLFINVSYAKKLDAKNALGASLIVAWQRFRARGVEAFAGFSSDPSSMSGNKNSTATGAGIKLGYQGEVSPGIRLGASYQSKISMSEFDEYKGLFAEGGDFDIPSTYNIGISIDINKSSTFVADVQRINYSEIAAISNPIGGLFTCAPGPTGGTGDTCLGGSKGAGFGWEDMTIFKIGYQFEVDGNTYRLGFSHTSQPIPEGETLFNLLAPAVIENHITAGMTMPISGNQEFNIAAMYAPSNSVKGDNPFDRGATQIEIEMSQFEIQAGWAWKY